MSTCVAASIDIALLGCGNVGTAFAHLAHRSVAPPAPVRIRGAMVNDTARPRAVPRSLPLTRDGRSLLAGRPDIVVELLGGVEPARHLLLEALERRIPVVTANKTLLARHGAELRAAGAATATPLLYEAAVVAGVPFLGTFARRPQAASVTGLVGIANGTSNFVLTRMAADGVLLPEALADAHRRGYAEPDPRHDVRGIDAVEKLAVLLQHFAGCDVDPEAIETGGIDGLTAMQTAHAAELGGVIKPVVAASWKNGVEAFAGPAFVPAAHVLARVDGVENALLLDGPLGRLLFQGPGAGPDVTAAAVLDDVHEIAAGRAGTARANLTTVRPLAPETGWMLTFEGARLPRPAEIADALASRGVYPHRASARHTAGGREVQSLLVWPCARGPLQTALAALEGTTARSLRAV